ncbi:MAG: RsmE family RNA methyltransferase [bacterium]
MEFYYLAEPPGLDGAVLFDKDESRHIVRSRRHRVGDRVFAVDGQGNRFLVELSEADGHLVRGRVLDSARSVFEPRVSLTLAQGVLKGDRLAEVVTAAVQLGVNSVLPFKSARTVGACGPARVARLRKVALEAMKSSRRAIWPEVSEPVGFGELVERSGEFDSVLVAWEQENEQAFGDVLDRTVERVMLVIGPEGGFEEAEVGMFKQAGAKTFSLGPRPMRAELAGVVAVSALLFALGEMMPASKCQDRKEV